MIGNLLFLALFVGLTFLFGWLTWRAIRASKLWVKIAGSIGAGLLTALCAALAFLGGKGLAAMYLPGANPAPDITVAGTADQIDRGEYLVNCLLYTSATNTRGRSRRRSQGSGLPRGGMCAIATTNCG